MDLPGFSFDQAAENSRHNQGTSENDGVLVDLQVFNPFQRAVHRSARIAGVKSPLHSLTSILANKQRKLVLTPDFKY
jgi:hypothetical protein